MYYLELVILVQTSLNWKELNYSTFTVHRNFKVSPSTRCFSAANAVYRNIDIFNKDCIRLTDVSQLPNKNNCSLSLYRLFVFNCFLL
jgi:hypothetical protein